MTGMKTLVVVDVQRDFYHPEGSLYVKGGERLPAAIAEAAPAYDAILFTMDWHPADHCSFTEYGGIWPRHCIQYSEGAGLPDVFAPLLVSRDRLVKIHLKASERMLEQYGAFDPMDDLEMQLFCESEEIHFCGIAGDYCVKETVANVLRFIPAERLRVIDSLVCSIDDGSILKEYLGTNNIKIL